MNVLLIGPPGSGKGTQGERLSKRLGIEHLAAGDILRAEVAAGTELGNRAKEYLQRGALVPDAMVVDLMLPVTIAAAHRGGYLLDGFPRSVDQAIEAKRLAEESDAAADVVVYLDAPSDVLIQRLLRRAEIQGRADDTLEVIENRLRVFELQTRPLIEYYEQRGLLVRFDAQASPEVITDEITAAISGVLEAAAARRAAANKIP
ncbi:adenylate kinase [Jatrophihabitans sp. GAS493]|uniref:adenylate kinase n=1 Tax=Jatrophihabitans sp. GAS493 TaxID=1907575 RepID=UPI000BB83825|nr:adenylate kinase [Jatrophihabitans sp. GAS493]SOD70889.1 adenylate kinase [Jatrophihabitans sp. GAS493]